MDMVLETIISFLISLAANATTDVVHVSREARLRRQLEGEDALRKALASTRTLPDELRAACGELARNRAQSGATPQEEPLWRLLSDDGFQVDLIEWFKTGGIAEGSAVKERLLGRMRTSLVEGGAKAEQIASFEAGYFDAVDKIVFANPILANWRHQLSLDYLREQVAALRQRAEEAAGVYSPDKQEAVLNHYCEMALTAWDIIDLSNLPEGDIHMATQTLLLRQLYMPLRIEVEPTKRGEGDDASLARLEKQRESRRHREAGHLFADEPDQPNRAKSCAPVGERLGVSRRLVVLGDPGGGKTTMLRWMATAYLLRQKGDDAFSQLPDTQTLPSQPWIPVLIRCRDLGEANLCQCFSDFLTLHLNKTELLPEEAAVMRAVILDRIAKGEILLLVDGLDEITNSRVRMMFCQELERTAVRYPEAPIVITSRIVGYRDMPYRMGSGFEHGQIAELNREDKDLFAWRWVEVTEQHQPAAEKAKHYQELLDALHSSERIERLTCNPMLLTTLALVKRKVGKLPNRRNKLYSQAVSTLLNWNPEVHQTIEEDEAIPQLGYIAYEMCRLGVQRLTGDEVLGLLEKVRTECPNVRAIRGREPQAFLVLLEERSSILIKSGGVWQKNATQEKAVWEFRHLTFQEYLAARALLDGRYPGRDKAKSLAEQVASLAGAVETARRRHLVSNVEGEVDVPESWQEALRLLVADCRDDDVDDVLLAILNPMAGEDTSKTERPRAALAALCLADEPNVAEENAERVLAELARKVGEEDGTQYARTSLDRAALEVGCSMWARLLKKSLIQEFYQRPSGKRWNVGGLWGMAEVTCWRKSGIAPRAFFTGLVERLKSGDRVEMVSAALAIAEAANEGLAEVVEDLPSSLLDILAQADASASDAAARALAGLSRRFEFTLEHQPGWVPEGDEVNRVSRALDATPASENPTRRLLVRVLGRSEDSRVLSPLTSRLNDPDAGVCIAVAEALGDLGDPRAVAPLLSKLDDPDLLTRWAVIEALGDLGDPRAVAPLLSKLDESIFGILDDPDTAVRRTIVEALGDLGDPRAVASLLSKLDAPDTCGFRWAVIEALGKLGDPRAVAPLLSKLDDPDLLTRWAVIEALGKLGNPRAVGPLLSKLDESIFGIHMPVAKALGKLGDRRAVAPLLSKLDAPDADVRTAVVEALGKLGDRRAVASLLSKLDDPDADVRTATAEALGKLGDKLAIGPLTLLLDDSGHEVCVTAATALVALGDCGLEKLREYLCHESPERRAAAVGELVSLRNKPNERTLLSRDLDGLDPWMDPRTPITERRVAGAARSLGVSTGEARSLYESIAADFRLVLAPGYPDRELTCAP